MQQSMVPVVQYLWCSTCGAVPVVEQGAAKEVRDGDSKTPVHETACGGHLHVVQCYDGLK